MGIGGDALRIWTALGVGTRLASGYPPRPRGCHRLQRSAKALPPSAKGLPLSAKTCHPLPRPASSLGGPRRSTGPLRNIVVKGGVAIILLDLKLWRIDVAQRTAIRSGVSDLFSENDREGTVSTVTACHITQGFLGHLPGLPSTAPLFLKSETCGRRFGWIGDAHRTEGETRDLRRTKDLSTAIRRQFGVGNRRHGDLGRQPTTEFGAPSGGWRRCFVEPTMIGVSRRQSAGINGIWTYGTPCSVKGQNNSCL